PASAGGPRRADACTLRRAGAAARGRLPGPAELRPGAVRATLAADKVGLQMVVDVFGPVTVVSAGTPPVWPPKGGFVPAWRRVSPTRPLIVLPSERVSGWVDPFTVEPPTALCPKGAGTRTRSGTSDAILRTGSGQPCARCECRPWPPPPA